jgi:hypothetical protein
VKVVLRAAEARLAPTLSNPSSWPTAGADAAACKYSGLPAYAANRCRPCRRRSASQRRRLRRWRTSPGARSRALLSCMEGSSAAIARGGGTRAGRVHAVATASRIARRHPPGVVTVCSRRGLGTLCSSAGSLRPMTAGAAASHARTARQSLRIGGCTSALPVYREVMYVTVVRPAMGNVRNDRTTQRQTPCDDRV